MTTELVPDNKRDPLKEVSLSFYQANIDDEILSGPFEIVAKIYARLGIRVGENGLGFKALFGQGNPFMFNDTSIETFAFPNGQRVEGKSDSMNFNRPCFSIGVLRNQRSLDQVMVEFGRNNRETARNYFFALRGLLEGQSDLGPAVSTFLDQAKLLLR